MNRFQSAALLSLLLGACENATGPGWLELSANRRKWDLAGPADYTYEFRRICYCLLEAVQAVRITVRDGAVESVVSASSGDPIPPDDVDDHFRVTIDSLFALVAAAAGGEADEVRVTYDPVLGYPREIFIDYYAMAIDDEMSFTAAMLAP